MPITRELENVRKLESVGFTHEQSETLADVIEQSHVNGQESLKEFIRNENKDIRADIKNENKDIRAEISAMELRMKASLSASLSDLLLKIFAIVVGCTSLAIAVVKVLG